MIKNVVATIDKVNELLNSSSFLLTLPQHHLDGNEIELSKNEREYSFFTSVPIVRGLQLHQELKLDRNDLLELQKDKFPSIYILGKHFLINNISYSEDDRKLLHGTISSFSSTPIHVPFNNVRLRMVIPNFDSTLLELQHFQSRSYRTPQGRHSFYVPVEVDLEEYHVISYVLGENKYLIIDAPHIAELNKFQKKAFNVLLALGFVRGNLIHDECFIFSYTSEEMNVPEAFLYFTMRSSVITNQAVFTSNHYSILYEEIEHDANGNLTEESRQRIEDGSIYFPISVLSNLATNFYRYEKLQRAALLFIQSHICSLEMRLPNYYVAIEAITGHIIKEVATGKKDLSPMKDKNLAKEVIDYIIEYVENLKNSESLTDDEFNLDILKKNIAKLNAPPNADKLAESFSHFAYTLTDEQKKVLNNRNTFLHGSFLKTADDDIAFRQGLHTALRLHFMISYLMLRLGGFSGKIINYAKLWSHITEMELPEDKLVNI